MLCENCGKNEATTHIKKNINGVKSEKHLCAECAAKEGIGSFADTSLNGMLASMFGDALALNSPAKQARCKCCGSTFYDISKRGKAGCPECYKTFYNEFLPYLKRVHGSVKHIGKTPSVIPDEKTESKDTLSVLKEKLALLIKEEKFEQAAEVRDKIRELEDNK